MAKDHTKALVRRLKLWTDGHLAELLRKVKLYKAALSMLMHLKPSHSFRKILWNKCKKLMLTVQSN